jgi:hypothetical protein
LTDFSFLTRCLAGTTKCRHLDGTTPLAGTPRVRLAWQAAGRLDASALSKLYQLCRLIDRRRTIVC